MKRTNSIIAALVAVGVVAAGAAPGAAAPAPQIEDPLGDANFVNDQGTGDGSFGDFNQADAGTVSDILAIRMSNDAKNLYIAIDTEATPPAATAIGFRVRVNPDGAGGTYCLAFEVMHPGANNNLTAPEAHLRDDCAGGDVTEIQVLGSTLVIPRSANEAFGKGAKLTAPQAQSFLWSGTYPQGVAGPYADTTKVGTDYTFKK